MKLLIIAFWLLCSTVAAAHEIRTGELVIVHPMVEPAGLGQPRAEGKLRIMNEGSTSDRLLSISTEFAEKSTSSSTEPVDIPAGGQVTVQVVFEIIKNKLSEDEVYTGELDFEKAGAIKVELMVHTRSH
jgi:copper(I)-binding protein